MSLCIAFIVRKNCDLAALVSGLVNTPYQSLIVIDDGAGIEETEALQCTYIVNDEPLGYGSCLAAVMDFAVSENVHTLITMDPSYPQYLDALPDLIKELNYGYDLVKASRLLENFDGEEISDEEKSVTLAISELLGTYIDMEITDPLSPVAGYKVDLLKKLELVDHTPGAHLQILLQTHYLDAAIHEIPLGHGVDVGGELDELEIDIDEMKTVLETEFYLYRKGTMN